MGSLSSLPPELLVQIFSTLPVPSLAAVPQVSKSFCTLFTEPHNEAVIWRNACYLHGLISEGNEPPRREWGRWRDWHHQTNVVEGEGGQHAEWAVAMAQHSPQSLLGSGVSDNVVNWKAFLKRRLDLHRSWSGDLPSDIVHYRKEDVRFGASETKSYMAMLQHAVDLAKEVEGREGTAYGLTEDEAIDELNRVDILSSAGDRFVKTAMGVLQLDPETRLTRDEKAGLVALVLPGSFFQTNVAEFIESLIPSPKDIHRFKVDERNGFMVSTQRSGGLIVTDIAGKEMLWCLPQSYVREYAHLEYEQGYMIFDRDDGATEVWRSSSLDPPRDPIPATHRPDKRQRIASALANGDDDDLLRSIVDEGLLHMPDFGNFRSVIDAMRRQRKSGRLGLMDATSIAATLLEGDQIPPEIQATGWASVDDIRRAYGLEVPVSAVPSDEPSGSGSGKNTKLSPRFVPHMIIPVPTIPLPGGGGVPDHTSAFRFVYPHLLCASRNRAYVTDVTSGQQVQVVPATQDFVVPTGYPRFGSSEGGSSRDVTDKDKASALAEEIEGDVEDSIFPTFRPFESGFFDQNAAFSDHVEAKASSGNLPTSMKGDPLSIRTNSAAQLSEIRYVELGERWIFVCGQESLRAFSRGKEFFDDRTRKFNLDPGQIALRIPSDKVYYARWSASLGEKSFRGHWGSELVRQEVVWDESLTVMTEEEANSVEDKPLKRTSERPGTLTKEVGGPKKMKRRRLLDRFIAVHVSPDQKHLVALLSSSRLLFVPWFERVIAGEVDLWDVALDIQLGGVRAKSVYLSYGTGESGSGGSAGRISVVTKSGIFIVTPYLKSTAPSSPLTGAREVDITVHRLAPAFMEPHRLAKVSCLQMSDTGLWINWTTPEPKKPPPPRPDAHKIGPGPLDADGQPLSGLRPDWEEVAAREKARAASIVALSGGRWDDDDDDDDWEDEDDDEGEGSDRSSEEGTYDPFDEGSDAGVYPGDPPGDWRAQWGEETFKIVDRDGKMWKTSSRYPMVAMEVEEGDPLLSQGLSGGAKGKGKEPVEVVKMDTSPARPAEKKKEKRAEWWYTQRFDLDETPPSQYAVKGGKCKWNAAERQAPNSRSLAPGERRAFDCEHLFKNGLKDTRVGPFGMPGSGSDALPSEDFTISLDEELGLIPFRAEEERCEIHQVRFVPTWVM
ncbi:hypothetical protein DFP72DRAFT_896346 [Ephemerocybe angulata]|uniref:F-box domain-containing protein n=1 Tax=Ephemerocybe angulata TaxID=980116 RepID=A0A8H6M4V6_9AGAR|nr:hypothetical protein DFP72DRAFT_896346 [Tulosesus angulatus]